MKKAEPTKGPWIVGDGQIHSASMELGEDLIVLFNNDGWNRMSEYACSPFKRKDTAKANAHLMAAAHELRDACRAALTMLVPCNPQDPDLQGLAECPREHKNACGACVTRYMLLDAIAKSENY